MDFKYALNPHPRQTDHEGLIPRNFFQVFLCTHSFFLSSSNDSTRKIMMRCCAISPTKNAAKTWIVNRISVTHLKISVPWRTGLWWRRWQPVRSTTAARVWPRVHVAVLCWITVMSTVAVGWGSRVISIGILVNRTVGSSIKRRSPVITRWNTSSWARATFCKLRP